ncbi:hypothetical protein SELMODRAFT_185926 [Selaginella moellendorffii]|uniref:PhoD-like phosphatase metallophosphatase domain-containing protein n=1 Tax=Selaginella moellendorffii TaxID=88036 RepID=D8T6N4_SELML|nr:uncharacterized protein LOC9635478 [Selaginella moellendorffii]EFJ07669.1 hypothetical protein SELMODRAFT_185926 [Selaginella moellendorffii]|eukprot:XP_002991241.1 uncharacterized protein LOC9635478 [Selaginella moellendorffii]
MENSRKPMSRMRYNTDLFFLPSWSSLPTVSMGMLARLFYVLLLFLFSRIGGAELPVVSRIAFGSCAHQDVPQPIWSAVLDFKPEVFIWLGDNIYADNKRPTRVFGKERTAGPWKNIPRFSPVSLEEMAEKYRKGKSVPEYKRLRATTQIIGTWDDHDYGLNDAGKEFEGKRESQKLMLENLDEPLDSPRWSQEGVYTSYSYGPLGKRIKVILLDTRYHRDPIFSDGTVLGEKQWTFLEKELTETDAQINIIASSIQVLGNFSSTVRPFFHVEAWSHFPKEQERLFDVIARSNASGVVFISGDVHFGEITRYDCGISYPLYDVTSSGLTQAVEQSKLAPLARFSAWLMPTSMRVYNQWCRYSSCVYGKQNFGTFLIDWTADNVKIIAEIRDVFGRPALKEIIPLSKLQAQDGAERNFKRLKKKIQRHCTREVDLPWYLRYRLAAVVYSLFTVVILAVSVSLYCLVRVGSSKLHKKSE